MPADAEVVLQYIESVYAESLREPSGPLRHRFIDPGAGYRNLLWDWDAHFCAMGLEPWAARVGPYVHGCVLNFLDVVQSDGSVPYCLNANVPEPPSRGPRAPDSAANSIKPLLAQMTRMACAYTGRTDWAAVVYDRLGPVLRHWRQTQFSALGLYTFRSHRGSGADNHPGVYGRPLNSSADVFLNCLMVRELEAMADLAADAARPADADDWRQQRDALAAAVQQMWDPIDGMFYNLDVQRTPIERTRQAIDWVVPLKFRCWTAFMPLWAGVATPQQARRLVDEHLTQPGEFWSDHGLRSMAACEPAYTNFADFNPSNWQGPIWVVSNYLTWQGLIDYGFADEAAQLARRLLATLARDIRAHGCLHEYYHGDTGVGLMHPGFVNWNTLAARMAVSTPAG